MVHRRRTSSNGRLQRERIWPRTRLGGLGFARVWQEVEQATLRILESITIQDLADRERAGNVERYAI